uniref:Actin-related protein 5 n=1 Tax=Timema cristinae TaxID=61476 RepID=A0A7R9CSF0_TIMCR|nr:unnamed protein product [Timema cristinae]
MTTLEMKEVKTIPDVIHVYPNHVKNSSTPLIIDNGSYNCRAGWGVNKDPSLIFKNLIAKPRKERGKKDGDLQVGNDITNIEAVRFQLKSQFDRNVVTHFEAQEHVLDYIFTHLGVDTEGCVNHPVIITEAFLNPNYSRHCMYEWVLMKKPPNKRLQGWFLILMMSELLFECYKIPSVCYGVDSLFSFHHNNPERSSGLVVDLGYHATHVLPVIEGRVDPNRSRRINVGGAHIINYLHRLLQLKYPAHFNSITLSRAEWFACTLYHSRTRSLLQSLVHEQCFLAVDYQAELQQWSDSEHYESHVRRIQLPYTMPVVNPGLTIEQQKERRKELARRLTEINARKREERLAEDEEQLNQLLAAQDLLDEGEEEEFQLNKLLAAQDLLDEGEEEELQLNQLLAAQDLLNEGKGEEFQDEKQLNQLLAAQDLLDESEEEFQDGEQLNQLLAVQDLLDEGEGKEFQNVLESYELSNVGDLQKMISSIQARIERTRQKIVAANTADDPIVEESKVKQIKQGLRPKEQEEFESWIEGLKQKRQELLDRRNARRQRRQDMAKRRTAAAQERMRIISQLARKEKRDDNFGMRDEDWDVYKVINKECGDSDSDEEQKLLELEEVLRRHDPEFEGSALGRASSSADTAETYQLHVGIERIRTPEILFQPSMVQIVMNKPVGSPKAGLAETIEIKFDMSCSQVGSPEAGLAETIEFVLKGYSVDVQSLLVSNIFLTGGCASMPGLVPRLEKELREMRPFESQFHLTLAADPVLDAWHGAQELIASMSLSRCFVTRAEYEEKGGEFFKEHSASNHYFPSPVPLVQAEIVPAPACVEEVEIDVF